MHKKYLTFDYVNKHHERQIRFFLFILIILTAFTNSPNLDKNIKEQKGEVCVSVLLEHLYFIQIWLVDWKNISI